MIDRKVTPQEAEASFRSLLEDVGPLIASLAPLCQNMAELVSMVELAVINDGQLRLLMERVLKKDGAKRT